MSRATFVLMALGFLIAFSLATSVRLHDLSRQLDRIEQNTCGWGISASVDGRTTGQGGCQP